MYGLYQSTGENSGYPGTWVPFKGISVTGWFIRPHLSVNDAFCRFKISITLYLYDIIERHQTIEAFHQEQHVNLLTPLRKKTKKFLDATDQW